MGRIFNFNHTPGIKSSSNLLSANINHCICSNNGKWHWISQILDLLFEVLVLITVQNSLSKLILVPLSWLIPVTVWQRVDFDIIVLDFLQDFSLQSSNFSLSQTVWFCNDWHNADLVGQLTHHLRIEWVKRDPVLILVRKTIYREVKINWHFLLFTSFYSK